MDTTKEIQLSDLFWLLQINITSALFEIFYTFSLHIKYILTNIFIIAYKLHIICVLSLSPSSNF